MAYRYFKCCVNGGFRLTDLNKNIKKDEYFYLDSKAASISRGVQAALKHKWITEVTGKEAFSKGECRPVFPRQQAKKSNDIRNHAAYLREKAREEAYSRLANRRIQNEKLARAQDAIVKKVRVGKQKLLQTFNDDRNTCTESSIKQLIENHQKVVTFCMCLKNRPKNALESIKTLVNEETSKYFDFIVTEDQSPNLLDLSNFKYKGCITQYVIQTGDSWNRSKTLNYGFKRAKTPLVAAWDTDFMFPENFLEQYLKIIQKVDFTRNYSWISCTETNDTWRSNKKYNKGSLYGGFYTYSIYHLKMLGAFDESFVNFGYEERDFMYRVSRFFKNEPAREIKAGIVYHKSHGDELRGDLSTRSTNQRRYEERTRLNINVIEQPNWGMSKMIEIKNVPVKDTLIIMGNGPSLKNIDFEILRKHNTMGMNGAYRYYYKNNWWPRYFCCFDYAVTDCHTNDWKKMIEDPNIPIEKYFLLRNISDNQKLKFLKLHGEGIGNFSTTFQNFGDGGNTGVNACQVGICLGYKKLIIVGIDCDYIQLVDGAEKTPDGRLIIKQTPNKNPNYFWDEYQQTGDIYNVPNAQRFHLPAWEKFAIFAKINGIDVVNCSSSSKLTCFRKSTLEKEGII